MRQGEWLIDREVWQRWGDALRAALEVQAHDQPLEPTLTLEAARAAAGLPDRSLVPALAGESALEVAAGRVGCPG